jgi:hypothetical protein
MDIHSLLSNLSTTVSALQVSVSGVSVAVDTTGLATVMGPAVKTAGVQTMGTLQSTIRDDPPLKASLDATTLSDQEKSAIRRSTRLLMTAYANNIADSVYSATLLYMDTQIITPTTLANSVVGAEARRIAKMIQDISAIAVRMQSISANSSATTTINAEYIANIKFVTVYSAKLLCFNQQVVNTTSEIENLMLSTAVKDSVYSATLKTLQEARAAVTTERKYAEIQILEHFDCGGTQQRAGVKINLTELVIPANISKGKGVELIKNVKAFTKGRAPWLYAVFPELIRILDESRIGNHHKPPTKLDGFAGVPAEVKETYLLQAQELYDQLDSKVPKEIMANIRKPFKYGMADDKACCEIGDGPMAIFCILALYRPSGEIYRDEVKDKMLGLPSKFTEGCNPAQKIHDNQAILQEALDLDIKIPWNRTGKQIVSILSERSNTFARVLRPYAEVGGVVDREDSAVELSRMFSDIVEACKELQESGLDIKRAMNIDHKTAAPESGASGDQDNMCHFGADCTRKVCTFGHTKADNAKRAQKSASRGKGSDSKSGKGKGSGKGATGGGKSAGKAEICKAFGCKAPGGGFRFCTKCHRKGIETGGKVKHKDGTMIEVKLSKSSLQDKRIAQLEKQLIAVPDADGDDAMSDDEPADGSKRKRANIVNVMDRLGLPNKRAHTN